MRNVIGVSLRNKARTRDGNHDQHGIDADPDRHAGLLALGHLQNYPSRQRVVGRDHQRKAKNSGDRRQLHKYQISRRHISKQIPRKADGGHVHGRKFHRHPEERRREAGSLRRKFSQPRNHRGKHRVEQGQ